MRTVALLLTALVTLAACGSSTEPEPTETMSREGLTAEERAMLDEGDSVRDAPSASSLWSLCADHARSEVQGQWAFPFPDDAQVEQRGEGWRITGTAQGPADQGFSLSCIYEDVTAEGATLIDYSLA